MLSKVCSPILAVEGPVLICRSPCNFPGDIQRAYAIQGRKTEPYKYLNNVVVFSDKGDRPFFDELAGGDLVRKLTSEIFR